MMCKLNFPSYDFRLKKHNENYYIFDSIRRKFVFLTPEEWVRQHAILFLTTEKKYPSTLISVEKEIKLYDTSKRYDIVVHTREGEIKVVVECKSPNVTLTPHVFDQLARYNLVLKSSFFWITNGMEHYFYKTDIANNTYQFINDIPKHHLAQT